MKQLTEIWSISVLFYVVTSGCSAKAQTSEQVLNRYAEAIGGRDRWNSLRSMCIVKRGHIVEDSRAIRQIKEESGFAPAKPISYEIPTFSSDTLYFENPDKSVSILSTPMRNGPSIYRYEYYNGQRMKREVGTFVSIDTDENHLKLFRNRGKNYFTSQIVFSNENVFSWVGEKEFNKKWYNTLKFTDKFKDKDRIWWYMFDKTSGLLEVIKGVNMEGYPYTLLKEYKEFDGFNIPTNQETILNNELVMSIGLLDFEPNMPIPARLASKL